LSLKIYYLWPGENTNKILQESSGVEIDLVLELPGKHGAWAIEIKKGLSAITGKRISQR
jgi:hypothetical protein